MIDRYTKFILTLIAVGLLGIAAEGLTPRAYAQTPEEPCGGPANPCHITNEGGAALTVTTEK